MRASSPRAVLPWPCGTAPATPCSYRLSSTGIHSSHGQSRADPGSRIVRVDGHDLVDQGERLSPVLRVPRCIELHEEVLQRIGRQHRGGKRRLGEHRRPWIARWRPQRRTMDGGSQARADDTQHEREHRHNATVSYRSLLLSAVIPLAHGAFISFVPPTVIGRYDQQPPDAEGVERRATPRPPVHLASGPALRCSAAVPCHPVGTR